MSCYRHEGAWYVRGRHDHDGPTMAHPPLSDDYGCDGCERCNLHCTHRKACKRHLSPGHPLTAPECVGEVRDDLRAIVDLSALLPSEAEVKGVDSDAADLAGPAADAEAWSNRKAAALAGRAWHVSTLEEDDEAHPLRVLGTWDFMLREDYDQPTALRATVSRCADYLDGVLGRLAQDDGQDFPLFAREVRACRRRLEAVLHDGEQRDTGAPCMACSVPLVRVWGDDEQADGWECPRCRERSTEAQYRFAVQHLHREEADTLATEDMAIRTGVPASTIRRWAGRRFLGLDDAGEPRYAPPRLTLAGRDHRGRRLYAVTDVLTLAGVSLDSGNRAVSK